MITLLIVSKTNAIIQQKDDYKTYYVDANAPDGGNGSEATPFNSFEKVVGYFDNGNYMPGLLRGGDHLYLKGSFTSDEHDEVTNNKRLVLYRPAQGGTAEKPTIIKSYGKKKAVFDPNYSYIDPVHVRNIGGNGSYVVIKDIVVTRSSGRGIMIGDGVGSATLSGILAYNNQANGGMGSGGAVVFDLFKGKSNHVIYDSTFYNNRIDPDGHPDNRGAISILSKPTAADGSTVQIVNNVFRDEHIAIRQKHSGNVTTTIEGNQISNCTIGVFLRAFENHVIRNRFRNVETVISVSEGNANGNLKEVIKENQINGARTFIDKGGNTEFSHDYEVTENSFTSENVRAIFNLSQFSNINFDLSRFKVSGNTFDVPESAVLLIHKAKKHGFDEGMRILKR